MTRTPSVSLEFKRLSIPEKIIFAENVSSLMATNAAKFTNPDVTLVVLNGLITTLSSSTQAAASGDHQKVTAMHSAERKLETSLETQAMYVDRIAIGDAATILLSGFKATTSETKPSTNPDAVTGIKITSSQQPGAAHVESAAMKGVTCYLHVVSTTPDAIVLNGNQFMQQKNAGVISHVMDTHRKIDFTGLPSGQSLFLTVIAFNSAGAGAIHAPVTFRTL